MRTSLPRTGLTLRAQLLLLVGAPLLLLLIVETAVSYRIGMHTADLVFDRWLLHSAYSLSLELRHSDGKVQFVADSTKVFERDEFDGVHFRIDSAEGKELIAGTPSLKATAEARDLANPVFADVIIDGTLNRAVSVLAFHKGGIEAIVTVAETLDKRRAMTSDLLFEVLLSKGLFFAAVMLVIGAAFDRGLRPLVHLSTELAHRSPQDLTPIEVGRVPSDLRGLVESTNLLLSRIDSAISSREQFIGNIAHQIRTPLAGMKLQAQLAQRDDDVKDVQEALSKISHAADQISHVNSQLMKLARAESASSRGLRRAPIDLVAVARSACEALGERAREHDITLELQVPDHAVRIAGAPHLLSEMMSNLIENGIVYGRKRGRVWIRIEEETDAVTLVIEDDGPGIDRRHWPRIFERFFRPVPSLGEGCGLGLSIVREIALAHDASVLLEERQGGGARFLVRFDVTHPAHTHDDSDAPGA